MILRMLLLLGLSLVSISTSSAPVFKVSKGNDVLYIGGTFHLLTEKDYPLPDSFELAYDLADVLYFETNVDALDDPDFQPKLFSVITYQDGSSLKDNLTDTTYKRLLEYAKSRGLSMSQLEPLNPTGIMLTVAIMEYQSRGFVAQGVDKFFFDRAKADEKTVAWFETPSEQLDLLDSFDNDDPNGVVNHVLDDISISDDIISELHESWRNGNMEKLAEIGIEPYLEYPLVYKSIILDRNKRWVDEIELMFGNAQTEYVLVGALHLPGYDGVLSHLTRKGYVVEVL